MLSVRTIMSKQPEYIERNALIESFRNVADGVGDSPWSIEAIVELINRAPSVVVEPERKI